MTPEPAGTDRVRERWSRGMAMIAGRIDPAIARRWARALEGCPGPGRAEKTLLEASATTGIDHHAVSLARLWRQRPHLTGEALGLALLAAATVAEQAEQRRSSVVATGPDGVSARHKSASRTTGAALEEVVRAARRRLLVASYAHHPSVRMVEELTLVAQRGVVVDVLLEERTGALDAFKEPFVQMADQVRLWYWPKELRGANRAASMHAKVVAADQDLALVGSANLTGHALHHNIEVGVLVRDPVQVKRLVGHFRSLMSSEGPLKQV